MNGVRSPSNARPDWIGLSLLLGFVHGVSRGFPGITRERLLPNGQPDQSNVLTRANAGERGELYRDLTARP